MLDRKFKHRTFYKGANLSVRDFLELASEYRSFWMESKVEFNSDYLPDDKQNTYYILRCENSRAVIKLSDEEAEYFTERRNFWNQWHTDFNNNYKGVFDDAFINLCNTKKREIPEYLQAITKFEESLS